MVRGLVAVVVVVVVALAVAPLAAAHGGPLVHDAVDSLATDPVYVAPDADVEITPAQERAIEDRIASSRSGPVYVAILPAEARNAAGGDPTAVVDMLYEDLGRDGTYAAVVGRSFRALSNDPDLERGEAGRLATVAFDANRGAGVAPTLLDFVDRVGAAQGGGGGGGGDDGGGGGSTTLVVLLAAGAVIGGYVLLRRRRRASDEFRDVKRAAQDDLLALADDIRALDLDVEMPGVSADAKQDYAAAVAAYERADGALDRARRPEDLEAVTSALEEGRFAMASAKARLEGKPPPERRPPCFFDPRHGPSARDVEWTPQWGEARLVPACEADAQMVERGLEPAGREVAAGGRKVPYWEAGPAFGPWAGGYFGGLSGGLLPGILIGTMLGGGLGFPGSAYGGGHDGGGYDGAGQGDGDFGGGDFGGGDFGGGDFGGDAGGGGDF